METWRAFTVRVGPRPRCDRLPTPAAGSCFSHSARISAGDILSPVMPGQQTSAGSAGITRSQSEPTFLL